MESWELGAREQIRDLIARYAYCADGGRFRDLVLLFAEEGELEVPGRPPLRGRMAIEAFLEGVRTANAERVVAGRFRHHVSSLLIDVEDPDHAKARSCFSVIGPVGLDHWGYYRDRFVQVGERWLFRARKVTVDGRAVAAM